MSFLTLPYSSDLEKHLFSLQIQKQLLHQSKHKRLTHPKTVRTNKLKALGCYRFMPESDDFLDTATSEFMEEN